MTGFHGAGSFGSGWRGSFSSRQHQEQRERSCLGSVVAVMNRRLSSLFAVCQRLYFNKLWGMDIGPNCRISLSARLDRTYPRGLHIGERTAIDLGASILTHDYPRGLCVDTRVGKECNIGARSIIMPGIRIGDNCVVAAASVVIKDVPANCLVAGNPARIIEKGIKTGPLGVIGSRAHAKLGTASSTSDEKAAL